LCLVDFTHQKPENSLTSSIPLVSVVIPTQKRPHTLMEAIDRGLAQTDLEIIIVASGTETTKETVYVGERLAMEHRNVTFIRQPHGNVSGAQYWHQRRKR
jgi:hypothetical protein